MRFSSLVLLAACALFGCSVGPPSAEVVQSLRTRVETSGPVRGERLLAPETVSKFYGGRGFGRAWEGNDSEQIVEAIRGASVDGLVPTAYHLEAIEKLIQDKQTATSASATADLDILLTDGVAALVDHMRYGKVRPKSLNPSWNVDPREGAPPLHQELAKIAGSGSVKSAIESERPQHFVYQGLLETLASLREVAAKGGWPTVPEGKTIKLGVADPRIPAVRARLMATGELESGAASDSLRYDPALVKAVKLFQARHRLDANGIIDKDLVAAMNVSAGTRADQVRVNLERARWVLSGLSDDFMLVNLPAFKAYLIRGGKNVWESRTQIGDEAKQTPTFRADMKTVVLNPDWTVPPMILSEEVLPAMQRGEDYVTKKGLVILDANNQPVDPSSIDWKSATPGSFPYALRQPPDDGNALGKVKFLFPNPYEIYLHDTPSRSLFEAEKRTFSHGCIRLEKPLDLAEVLLSGQDGWNAGKIQAALATGKTVNVNLDHPLPILIVYWTVSVGASDEVRYMQDFYELDPPLLAALNR